MPKSKVKSSGLLLREAFYRNDNFTTEKKKAILSSMGINPTESFITLGTGANSSNNHLEIINAHPTDFIGFKIQTDRSTLWRE